MNKASKYLVLFLLSFLVAASPASAQKKDGNLHTVSVTVTEQDTKGAVIMATCRLTPLGAYGVTDVNGKASISNVPDGMYALEVSYVGYENFTTNVKVTHDIHLDIKMVPTNLSLKEVVVTAKQNASGTSTSSKIGRQAIDHLQASSLADIMQLVPGQVMGNTDLTSKTNLQLRQLTNNNTSAFGSSIIVDGVPMSNNGIVNQGQFSSTAFSGTDLRQISADDIDNVEVIRGIPSAEYGDLTSGLVVVHSKMGVTPWQFKGKTTPEMQNYSLGKGFSMGKAGVLNLSLDYAKAWGDPREKTRSYDRYTFNIGYGYDFSRSWHTDTKVRMMSAKDWSGNDPDAISDGTYSQNKNVTFGLTHNGKISVNKLLMRTLSYTIGVSLGWIDNKNSSYVANSTGLLPIITAMETGYYYVPWMTTSYLATGITESRPGNIYAKINDAFFIKLGNTRQSFKLGADYHYDWNSGKGYYNENDSLPYKPNSNGRPRAFSSIPGIHQIAAYAEDNFLWNINKVNKLRLQAGVRFTALQPFGDLATYAVSPRINMSFSITDWLDLRAGIGMNSKTPGLDYLYPDKNYDDRVAVNYMPQNSTVAQLYTYHTQVYEVQKSKDLKNATTTKIELGLDFKLPDNRKLSILAYQDKTPNGFGNAAEYFTYYSDVFTAEKGLTITPGQATTIDYSNPARHDLVFMSTGKIGNTNTTVNKGLEFDFDLGEIKPIHTSFQFSGAYSETKTWSTDLNTASVRTALLPSSWASYGITPFKVVYPSAQDYSLYRRFINTLRIVTNIPSLKMVASFTAQAIWYDFTRDYHANLNPTGWIDANLNYHDITSDMMNGYLGMDGIYYNTKPADQSSVLISDMATSYTNSIPTKNPVTWNLSARLTKDIGRFGGLSLYVNNCLFYEPYLKNSTTNTLTQRNTNNFSFGAELYLNL